MYRALNWFGDWMQRRWLWVFVVGLLIYSVVLPFLAPVLMWLGLSELAQLIYQPYKLTCHTYGFRSFFLFGTSFAYDRPTFELLSGIDTRALSGLFAARDFQGNATMGYKTALCQRDIAIYLAMAINGAAYGVLRRRTRPIPWWLLVLVGVVPIGVDGVSQLISQPPFNLIPFRESTWWLRLATGGLFGFSLAWILFPLVDGAVGLANELPRARPSRIRQ
ncbi:MAG: DUF2085 domain-containing protein [Anaerolineae bacterium]|nr:DUF2085 domain-containing protein [Thermoflexales bacterium]MDW8396041.1 DUF2085 domain-containing protein [Anaerolineae bacterium]